MLLVLLCIRCTLALLIQESRPTYQLVLHVIRQVPLAAVPLDPERDPSITGSIVFTEKPLCFDCIALNQGYLPARSHQCDRTPWRRIAILLPTATPSAGREGPTSCPSCPIKIGRSDSFSRVCLAPLSPESRRYFCTQYVWRLMTEGVDTQGDRSAYYEQSQILELALGAYTFK